MADYQILYWKDLPAQVKAESGSDEVNLELESRFMEKIDAVATKSGAVDSDDYLEHWQWSEPESRDGTAKEVARAVKAELEAKY